MARATTNEGNQDVGFLHDGHGKPSTKRLWGTVLLVVGITMEITTYTFSLFHPDAAYTTAQNIGVDVIIAGAGLLGIGVTEKFFSKRCP